MNYFIKQTFAFLFTAFLCLVFSRLMAQVSVTATAGTVGPTSYTTLNLAFAAINAGTHQGVISIAITGNTTEGTPVALLKSAAPSSYTSISIKPSGGNWTIGQGTITANRAIVELSGADNVTIDGDDPATAGTRNLTIRYTTTGATGAAIVRVSSNSTTGTDGADNNTVKNCNLVGCRTGVTDVTVTYGINMSNYSTTSLSGGGASSINAVFDNNYITSCNNGINCTGLSGFPLTGLKIRNNVIGDGTAGGNVIKGIYVSYTASATGQTVAVISGNDIQAGDPGSTSYLGTAIGMEINTNNYGIQIYNNNIHDIRKPAAGYAAGIWVTGATNMNGMAIYNNFIRDIAGARTSSSPGGSTGTTWGSYGIFFTAGPSPITIDHNTIVIRPSTVAATVANNFTSCIQITVAGVSITSFRNNILVNSDTSTNAYCLYTNATGNISGGTVDNNDYYVGLGKIGYYNAAAQTTLANWRTATGKDANAYNINPTFLAANDLHINGAVASLLESGGVAGTGITTDIDGQARPGPAGSVNGGGSAPDVGADEFDGLKVSCSALPTALNATLITTTTATISWTAPSPAPASGYDYYLSTSNTAPTSATVPTGTVAAGTTTVALTSLTPNTVYYFWVRSKCDVSTTSGWAGFSSFTTSCIATALPIFQGFNALTIPSCWTQQYVIPASAGSNLTYPTGSANPTTSPQEGTNYVYWASNTLNSGNETRLVSLPIVTTGTASVDVQFQWFHDNTLATTAGYNDEGVFVEYSTNGTTWTTVGSEVTRLGGVNGWNLKTFTLPAAAGNQPILYVGFRFRARNGANCSLDAVDIHATPPCSPQPSLLATSTIAATTATITWSAATPAPAAGYDYYFSTSSTTPLATTAASGTVGAGVLSANLTGLTTGVTYYFWVRSRCDASTTSSWTGAASFTTVAACSVAPTGLLSSAITGTTANISWTAATTPPASGYQYYYSTSNTAPTAATIPSGSVGAGVLTASLTGLTPSTVYYFWVRSLCSVGNASAWTASSTFTTACNASAVPWSENFDAMPSIGNSIIPSCWKIESTSGTPWASANAASYTYHDPASAPNYISCYYSPYTTTEKYLITPGFNLTAGTSYDFSFQYVGDGYSGWNVDAGYNTTQTGTGYTILGSSFLTSGTTTTAGVWNTITKTFVPVTSGVYYFMVHVNNNITPFYLGFDNFSVNLTPPCAQQPSALSSSAVTSNTATISWTAASPAPSSGYQYYYSTTNTAPNAATVPSGSTAAGVTTANLTGLSSLTTYYCWVRSNCNGTDRSGWLGPISFTTLCGSLTLPWSENFDAMPSIGTSIIPSCWKIEQASGTPWASSNTASNTYNNPASTPNYITCYYSPSSANKFLITPAFNLIANNSYQFSFQYVGDGYTGWTGDVGYNTTQTGTGYTVLGTPFITGTTTSLTTYTTVVQNFTPTVSGTYYFVIRVNNTATPWYLGFDNFSLTSLATCTGTPVGGTATATPSLGTVSSTFNLNATGYSSSSGLSFQWQTSSTSTGPWTNITGATTVSYNATAPATLNTTTYYQLMVTCSASGLSGYSSATSFTTNYCTPTLTTACSSNDYINNFTLNTLSNLASGCNGNPNNYILYPPSGTNTTTLTQGVTYNANITIGRGGSGNVAIWIDYNNNGVFETTERYVNATLVAASGALTLPIAVPAAATVGTHRLRVLEVYSTTLAVLDPCATYTYGETEDYTITIIAQAPCAGIPTPGNTVSNLVNVCTGNSVNLSLQNQTTGSGVTYQWQSGTSSTGPWNPIVGATSSAYTAVVSSSSWYRCVVTCSGSSGYSNPIQINASPCVIMPATGSSSVTTCSANFYDSGGSLGNYGLNENGTLTIYPSTPGSFVQVLFNEFDLETCCDNLKIYNGNSTAAPLLGTYTTNPGTIISSAADGSLTFVFSSDFSVSYTGWDATISCYTPPPCAGVPAPGNTNATNTFICTNTNSVLSVANPPAGSGVTYQWQSAPDVAGAAGAFSNVTGATSPTYTFSSAVATTVWYRCIVTCSGNAVNSNPIQLVVAVCNIVNMSNGSSTTCAARFYDNGGAGGNDNTSDAAGNYGNSQALTYTFYPSTPGAKVRVTFNSFALETCCDNLKIYDGNSIASLLLGVYTSNPGTLTSTAADGSLTFVFTSDGSINKSGWDATISCFIPPPCSGVPNAGVAATSPSTGAAGSNFSLNVTGLSAVTGLSYQWQSSTDGITWTNIPGATTTPYNLTAPGVAGVVSTMYYQLIVTCTNSGLTATSTPTSFITASYCIPAHTTSSTNYITKISFLGTLNDITNNSTYSATGYQDFTGLSSRAKQAQGEGVNLYIQSNTSAYMNGWADWNNDGTFDATEKIFTSGNILAFSSTFGFVIPATVPPGNYRIRIRTTSSGGSGYDACATLTNGETEDYLLNVISTCNVFITSVTNGQVCGSGTVDLSVTATAGATQYYWYTLPTGGIPMAVTSVPNWTSPGIRSSTYYYVTASNGTCESITRTLIKANIAAVPTLSFNPNNPVVCGEGAVLRLNATGNVEEAVLVNENFETGLGVFTVNNLLAPANVVLTQWQPMTSTYVPTNTAVWHPAISSGVGTNHFAYATSDFSATSVNTALESPVINTTNFVDLYADFNIYYSHYLADGDVSGTDSVIIEASTNGGTTWNRVDYYVDDQGIGTRFSNNSVNLSAYINNPSLKLRFRYRAFWSDGLAIDDVKIYGNKPLATSFGWSPINQNNLFIDSTGLTPYTGGSVPLIYIRPTLIQLDTASSLTFTATATLSNGCSASAPVTVTVTPSQWTGDVSNDWNNVNNWCSHVVPLPTTKVEIPSTAARFPIISAPATAKSIKLNAGSSLTVTNTGKFSVYGTLTNLGGAFDAKNGTIELAALTPQTLDSNLFVGNNVRNLIISNDSVKLRGPLNLLNKLSYTGNNRNFITNGNLTLKSSDTLTAFVSDLTNNNTISGNKITGQVTVERFLSARRAWRLLASPTQHDLQSIKQAWQEGAATPNANPTPRYGIQITSNRPTWLADGFDTLSPNGPSVKVHNSATNAYDGITSTNVPFGIGKAYMTFVRGDRSITQFSQAATTTISREKGTLVTGNYNIGSLGTADSQFVSIGNPYACAIDFTKLTRTNLRNAYYLYDPALSTLGGFFTCQVLGNTIAVAPIPPSYTSGNYNIQSGQGFFAMTQGGPGAISFTESAKSDGSILVSREANNYASIRTNLYRVSNGISELCDGTLHLFDDAFSNQVDGNDARKVTNFNENFAAINNGNSLAIETRKLPMASDTIFYKLSQLRYANYHFTFTPDQFATCTHQPYLEDLFLQSRTLISRSDTTGYDFNINSNAGSYASNRFRIVFESLQPVPVQMDAVSAMRNNDVSVTVSWHVNIESAVDHYEVERSLDGIHFISVLQQQPLQNNGMVVSYSVIDLQAPSTVCYYRIKSVEQGNHFVYSNIVKVPAVKLIASVSVSPNPVVNHQLRMEFKHMPIGKYAGKIFNTEGQLMQTFELNNKENIQIFNLTLNSHFSAGVYEIKLTCNGNEEKVIQFIKK